jgi:hypothetical protein
MAQQFTHTPRPPQIPDGHPAQRYFKRTDVATDDRVQVMRFEQHNQAGLEIDFQTRNGRQISNVTALLTADECESVARALLDAAHDLRTHNSLDLMVRAAAECVEGSEA